MSDQAVTYLVSRLAVATVEFLIVGFLVAALLAVLPHIGPRWRRRIWFIALCKPFITLATASFKGLLPAAGLVNGTLLGDVLFPLGDGAESLAGGATTGLVFHCIAYVWLVVTLVMLARVWVRAVSCRQAADDHLTKGYMLKPTSLRRLDPDLVIPPNVRIIVTPEDAGPATLGLFHPAILIPESLLPWVVRHRDPSPQERARFCQVLRHELAHVANRDDLLTLATMVMLCFFWFHPVAHWAYRRVRMNNELCCDEDVVASGVAPREYVETLMSIVAGNFSRRGFAMHMLGDASPASVLRRRLQYVLRERRAGESRPVWAYLAVAVVALSMPRFLGQGKLVEVLMRDGQHRLLTRAELHELGPGEVERVLTPGVVDDAWYALPEIFAVAAPSSGPAGVGVGVLAADAGLAAGPAEESVSGVPTVEGGTVLADATDEVGGEGESAGAADSAPKRKGRSVGWGESVPLGGSGPKPILPPPGERR